MGLKQLFVTPRAMMTSAVVLAACVLALLPLDRHVQVPAVFLPANEARIYPPEAAVVLQLSARPGDHVQKDQILARLFMPDISHLQRIAQLRLHVTEERLLRVAADAQDLAEVRVLEQERTASKAELEGLRQRGEMLVLRSPITGVVSGDAAELRDGQWVAAGELVFHIADESHGRIVGLVAEREVGRLGQGASVTFIAEDGLHVAVSGVVTETGMPGAEGVAASYLSSQFGGPIAVNPSRSGSFEPMTGRIPLLISTDSPAPQSVLTGTAKIGAEPISLVGFLLGRVVTVVMRESGF